MNFRLIRIHCKIVCQPDCLIHVVKFLITVRLLIFNAES